MPCPWTVFASVILESITWSNTISYLSSPLISVCQPHPQLAIDMNFFVLQDGLKIQTFLQAHTCLFWIILILFNLISSLFWGINYWHILVLYFITNLFFFLSFAPIPLSSMCIVSHFYSPITFVQIYLYDLVMLTLKFISKIHYQSIFWHYSYCCSYHQSCQLFSTHFLLHLPQSLPI